MLSDFFLCAVGARDVEHRLQTAVVEGRTGYCHGTSLLVSCGRERVKKSWRERVKKSVGIHPYVVKRTLWDKQAVIVPGLLIQYVQLSQESV